MVTGCQRANATGNATRRRAVGRRRWSVVLGALLLAVLVEARPGAASFVNFEAGPVRPVALSSDGSLLFALNIPDTRLAIFSVTDAGLQRAAEVPVGLEPVAVAVRTTIAGETEAWVVNHLSDSVSVVRVDRQQLDRSRVVATLAVGDEPRDVVFGGSAGNRAFITTARRGQHLRPDTPPLLTTPGVGRALVWVFDAEALPVDDPPLAVIELFGDAARALAVSPDGRRVYAAIFHSGSRTTVVSDYTVTQQGGLPLPPADSSYFDPAYDPLDMIPDPFPATPLIVRYREATQTWEDELGRDWGGSVRLSLPDVDVFAIDADATPPVLEPGSAVSGVGTILYGMAVRPTDGAVFVTNTEARNHVRFEPLIDANRGLSGHFAENRITVIGGTTATPVHLNPHIDFSQATGPGAERARSLGLPLAPAFSPDGQLVYVPGFGSANVGIYTAAALAAGEVVGTVVPVGGGPAGVAVDAGRDRLYVLNRFDHTISTVTDASLPSQAREASTVSLRFDPSPVAIKRGRRFLYDTQLSGHGDSACASCHVFGDLDSLAWDLGDPYGPILPNANLPGAPAWHPMKGPMVTQSLRGLSGAGPMHWRGDRTGASLPGGDQADEEAAFKAFEAAFVALLGAQRGLTDEQMQSFTDFALSIRYPPSSVRELDDQLTEAQARGEQLFGESCRFCHGGAVGTLGGSVSLLGQPALKIPHLRAIATKVGMFAQPPNGFEETGLGFPASPFLGPQIRGFGYFHHGMLAEPVVVLPHGENATAEESMDLAQFLMAFPTGLAPAVGQQVTVSAATVADPATVARRDLLLARAAAGDCDLIARGSIDGAPGGAVLAQGVFRTDRAAAAAVAPVDLWQQAGTPGHEQTYTCVPSATGVRMAIDRDEDGARDGDEIAAGTNPADPLSRPGAPPVVAVGARSLRLRDAEAKDESDAAARRFFFAAAGARGAPVPAVVPPPPGGAGDPTREGARLRVYNAAGSGEQATIDLPAAQWTRTKRGYRFRSDGPVQQVILSPNRIVIRGGGSAWTFSLDEPAQRRVAVRLTFGSYAQWCAEAPAGPTRTSGRDRPGRFDGQRKAPPPVECPAPPAG